MQKQVVILSLTLAAVSTGTAVWLALRTSGAPVAGAEPAMVSHKPVHPHARPAPLPASPREAGGQVKAPAQSAGLAWDNGTVGLGNLIREDVQTHETQPRPAHVSDVPAAELARRVAQIEKETGHEMRRLVGLLNLTEAQQDQVYEKLAASSRHWVPGMAIAAGPDGSGTVVIPDAGTAANPATDATEDIMSLLNADQQDTYLQSEMDRAAWWAEIITQLDAQTDIPAIDGTIPSEGDTKAYEGSETLE